MIAIVFQALVCLAQNILEDIAVAGCGCCRRCSVSRSNAMNSSVVWLGLGRCAVFFITKKEKRERLIMFASD